MHCGEAEACAMRTLLRPHATSLREPGSAPISDIDAGEPTARESNTRVGAKKPKGARALPQRPGTTRYLRPYASALAVMASSGRTHTSDFAFGGLVRAYVHPALGIERGRFPATIGSDCRVQPGHLAISRSHRRSGSRLSGGAIFVDLLSWNDTMLTASARHVNSRVASAGNHSLLFVSVEAHERRTRVCARVCDSRMVLRAKPRPHSKAASAASESTSTSGPVPHTAHTSPLPHQTRAGCRASHACPGRHGPIASADRMFREPAGAPPTSRAPAPEHVSLSASAPCRSNG